MLVEGVVVRDTRPSQTGGQQGALGTGMQVLQAFGQDEPSQLTVIGSIVERSANAAIAAFDSTLLVVDTIVRDTEKDAQHVGYGILAATDHDPLAPVRIEGSLVENSKGAGILLLGVDATITATEVRGTEVNSLGVGYALGAQTNVLDTPTPTNALLRGLLIEDNEDAGIAVFGSSLRVDGAVIRDTVPSASGDFGDAIQLQSHRKRRAEATLVSLLTERSSRAAISSFGATVYVEAAMLTCQAFDLSVEDTDDFAHALELGDFDVCGCDELTSCHVDSAGLSPLLPVE